MHQVTDVQRLSKRVASLKPSGIRKFFDIAATMKDVISLGIGEPDFGTGSEKLLGVVFNASDEVQRDYKHYYRYYREGKKD